MTGEPKTLTMTRELSEGTEENNIFPNEGSLICMEGKSLIYFSKGKDNKIAVVAKLAAEVHCVI